MGKKRQSDLERFHEMYVVGIGAGCWDWIGVRDRDGYGLIKVGSTLDGSRRQARAHRFAYESLKTAIPYGLEIDHLCRNRACVNPGHLEAVTSAVNSSRGGPANKTHCVRGHEFICGNVYRLKNGWRRCRLCDRIRQTTYEERKRKSASGTS